MFSQEKTSESPGVSAMTASGVDSAILPTSPDVDNRFGLSAEVAVSWLGEPARGFTISRDNLHLLIEPTQPVSRRCMIRPAALFQHDRGFPGVNMVMGRILFGPGATSPQRYAPFTKDPHRRFQELFLRVEETPDDALFSSVVRWRNDEAVAKKLLATAGVGWAGFSDTDLDELVALEPWNEPVEGCVLHALTQHTAGLGRCVIEIGSFRGQSLTMLAKSLRRAGSDSMLISIDPHIDDPHNQGAVRLNIARAGEADRLVQFACGSDQAWPLLKPETASLIFIDGDHSYQQVVADFRNYRKLLAPGGCLVFHDYGYGPHNGQADVVPAVRPAVDEHVFSDKDFSPLLLAHTLFAFLKRS